MAIQPAPIQSTINDFRIGWSFVTHTEVIRQSYVYFTNQGSRVCF
jgi:hypothetical protein